MRWSRLSVALVAFALAVPLAALAQLTAHPPQPILVPQSEVPASVWDMLRWVLIAVVFPILAAGVRLIPMITESWARARGAKWEAANAELNAKIRDAIAYVDAETAATKALILADGKVTAEEAARLQQEALTAAKRFLGAHGFNLIKGTLGIAGDQVENWLRGRIETVFQAKQLAENIAEPNAPVVVPVPAPSPQ